MYIFSTWSYIFIYTKNELNPCYQGYVYWLIWHRMTLQSFTSSVLESWFTPSNHRFFDLSLVLFPPGRYSMAALTAFVSSLRIACANHYNSCTFMQLVTLGLCLISRISAFVLPRRHFNSLSHIAPQILFSIDSNLFSIYAIINDTSHPAHQLWSNYNPNTVLTS